MLQHCRTHSNGGMAFSILFPMSDKQPIEEASHIHNSSTSSSVDCTLSLGTPSTRHTDSMEPKAGMAQHSSYVSTFCCDAIANSNKHRGSGSTAASNVSGSASNLGADPHLLARRCANCDTTSTPLWRNGPRGPKSLCNACGIRYKKEERRAAATTSTASTSSLTAQQWGCYGSTAGKAPSVSMYGEDSSTEDGEVPYHLSWRLNVVPPQPFPVRDRHSLFQYN